MTRDINYYKDLEKLNYSLYKNLNYNIPKGWSYLDKYDDKHTGFYAEAYKNPYNEVVMVVRGTDVNELHTLSGIKEFTKDFIINGLSMEIRKVPNQVESAYRFYEKLKYKFGDKVSLSGYSLGGSVVQILGNEFGLETVTYEAYGVGEFVQPKYSGNIINFGNENDIFYRGTLDKLFGAKYVIPDDNRSLNS